MGKAIPSNWISSPLMSERSNTSKVFGNDWHWPWTDSTKSSRSLCQAGLSGNHGSGTMNVGKLTNPVAWCGNVMVGILNVWANFPSVHEPGAKTLYIEHLGAAPGNIDTKLWNRRFFGIGTALLGYAVKMSQDQGFEGRLTLHASDAEALGFAASARNWVVISFSRNNLAFSGRRLMLREPMRKRLF
jgi:hypothetical protein